METLHARARRALAPLARIALLFAGAALAAVGGVVPRTLAAGLPEADGCTADWEATFGGAPGVDGAVRATCVFDDGSGPALYVGGDFTAAGGADVGRIARWDGQSWSELGSGVNGAVAALCVFDDGSGPALYAGGSFTTAGGQVANRIARWDGTSWGPVGSGMDAGFFTTSVSALCVFDDGSGPALYAGGNFPSVGGQPFGYIARWDGSTWSALGSGIAGGTLGLFVSALCVFDDGSGPALYVGGNLFSAGSIPGICIARWNGATWSTVGGGVNLPVYALSVFDDGSGPALYAGGAFTLAGGQSITGVARWNGSTWSSLGAGLSSQVLALAVFDDGSGPALHAGGSFTFTGAQPLNRVARWNGATWDGLGAGSNNSTRSLAVFDDGTGPALFGGGDFTLIGGLESRRIAKWNGSTWGSLGTGVSNAVRALAVFDSGSGPALHIGGIFQSAGGQAANFIARRDGSSWSPLGSGTNARVEALNVFDDGSGTALYAGGAFTIAGGQQVNGVARWDGVSWSALGSGVDWGGASSGSVQALAVFDDGSGARLYAGGEFFSAGGQSASRIARWDGNVWSSVGVGMNDTIRALHVFDDGSGSALYAGGAFTAVGVDFTIRRVARWNGGAWSALGLGVGGVGADTVYGLASYDDGSGPALYAGGSFQFAGGQAAENIARWNGNAWGTLAGGTNERVQALLSFDDGSGPALYAGGYFTQAGGQAAARVARWDGSAWSPLGNGVNGGVLALAASDDGAGPALFVGGEFAWSPAGDSFLAKWQGCPAAGFESIAGCFGNQAVLTSQSPGLVLGQTTQLHLESSGGGRGIGFLYVGALGVNGAGCGLLLPELGELLLSLAPPGFLLSSSPAVAGQAQFLLPVPNTPQWVGLVATFQGAFADVTGPNVTIELSNALQGAVAAP